MFIGPNDLSASLNRFRQFDDPEFTRAVDRILGLSQRHGIAAGYMASSAVKFWPGLSKGFGSWRSALMLVS